MQISAKSWNRYISKLAAINQAAADQMQAFIDANGFDDVDAIIRQANALATKYSEASAALTCNMYDAIAEAQGAKVRPAEPARTPTLEETVNVIQSALERAPVTVPDETGKLVKKTSTRTMRKNAARDGILMALVPRGDACVFCKMLGSRGWEPARASKSFEAHLHKNCRCEYVVRFSDDLEVEGYDPDAIYDEFMQYDGDWNQKMNAMRRDQYAKNKDAVANVTKQSNKQVKKVGIGGKATEDEVDALEYYVSGDGMYVNDYLRGRNGLDMEQLTEQEEELIKDLDTITSRDDLSNTVLYRSVDASAIFGDMNQIEYENLISHVVYEDNQKLVADDAKKFLDKAKGKEITEKGFMSTTKDSSIAESWGGFSGSDKPIVLELHTGDNVTGADVMNHANEMMKLVEADDPQKEVLLSRNRKLRIKEIRAKNDALYVIADVI